jgi:hypothetical protein
MLRGPLFIFLPKASVKPKTLRRRKHYHGFDVLAPRNVSKIFGNRTS